MNRRTFLLGAVAVIAVFSGCFIEWQDGATLRFDGNFSTADDGFEMNGDVVISGPDPPEQEYDDICLLIYGGDNELLYSERLGVLNESAQWTHMSVTLNETPQYIIFDSQIIWEDELEISYYERSEQAYQGYRGQDVTNRDELPVEVGETC